MSHTRKKTRISYREKFDEAIEACERARRTGDKSLLYELISSEERDENDLWCLQPNESKRARVRVNEVDDHTGEITGRYAVRTKDGSVVIREEEDMNDVVSDDEYEFMSGREDTEFRRAFRMLELAHLVERDYPDIYTFIHELIYS